MILDRSPFQPVLIAEKYLLLAPPKHKMVVVGGFDKSRKEVLLFSTILQDNKRLFVLSTKRPTEELVAHQYC